jgi:Plant transposon protein
MVLLARRRNLSEMESLCFDISRPKKKPEEHDFNDRQEAVRKSVERVFGFLLKRFNILYQPSRLHYVDTMRSVVLACVILHNMIVEVRRDGYAGVSGDSFSFEPSGATSIRTISKARTVQERVSQWQAVCNAIFHSRVVNFSRNRPFYISTPTFYSWSNNTIHPRKHIGKLPPSTDLSPPP